MAARPIIRRPVALAAVFAGLSGLAGTSSAYAQQALRQCPAALVQSVTDSSNKFADLSGLISAFAALDSKRPSDLDSAAWALESFYYALPAAIVKAPLPMESSAQIAGQWLFPDRLIAVGPFFRWGQHLFGNNLSTDVSCTPTGVLVTAVLTYDYIPVILRAHRWRPELRIVAAALRPGATLQVKWQVRLADRKEFEGKSAHDYVELKNFPIIVSKTLDYRTALVQPTNRAHQR